MATPGAPWNVSTAARSGALQIVPTASLSGNLQFAPMTATWGSPHCVPVSAASETQHNAPMAIPSPTPQYLLMTSTSRAPQNAPAAAYFGAPQYIAVPATAGLEHHVPVTVTSEMPRYVMMASPSETQQYIMMGALHETVSSGTSWNIPITAFSGASKNAPIFDSRDVLINASFESSQHNIHSSVPLQAPETQSDARKEILGICSASTELEQKSNKKKRKKVKKKPSCKQKRVEARAQARRLMQIEEKINKLLEMRSSVLASIVPAKEVSGPSKNKYKHEQATLEVQSMKLDAVEIKQELAEIGDETWPLATEVASGTDPVREANLGVKGDIMESDMPVDLGEKKTKRRAPSRLRREEARAEAGRLRKLAKGIQPQVADSEVTDIIPVPVRKHKYRGKRAGKAKHRRLANNNSSFL